MTNDEILENLNLLGKNIIHEMNIGKYQSYVKGDKEPKTTLRETKNGNK